MILENKRKKPRRQTKELTPRVRAELSSRTKYPKGRIIRVSSLVFDLLRRKLRRDESWDEFFRRRENIPQRDGRHEKLLEVWILPSTGEVFFTKALARGKSVKNGVLKGNENGFEAPRKLREII